jgi:Ca2+-binding RTX toxin-like protein
VKRLASVPLILLALALTAPAAHAAASAACPNGTGVVTVSVDAAPVTITTPAANRVTLAPGGNTVCDVAIVAINVNGDSGTSAVTFSGTLAVPVTGLLGDGNDAWTSTTSVPVNVDGQGDDDVVAGGDGTDQLDGGAGNDTLAGGLGVDTLHGGDGNDTIFAGTDAGDMVDGGPGTDLVSYAGAATGVTIDLNGGAATDTVTNVENATGGLVADSITGDGSANVLTGGPGADTVSAGAGDDLIVSDATARDIIDGGADTDRVSYAGVGTAVTVDFRSAAGGTDSLTNVENATGGANDDTFFGDATGGRAIAGGGSLAVGDTVDYTGVLAPTSLTIDLAGGVGTDTLTAIRNAVGGTGDDTFRSNAAGGRHLTGGGGVDTVTYAGTATALTIDLRGTAGTDTLTGFTNAIGGTGSDAFRSDSTGGRTMNGGGGAGVDSVSYAGVLAPTSLLIDLAGGTGTDTLVGIRDATGGTGNDTFVSNATGGRTLTGNGGTDTVSYAGTLAGVVIDLTGGAGTDTLIGFTNAIGGAGDDTFVSDATGGRTLTGNGGSDTVSYAGTAAGVVIDLTGGAGTDTLVAILNAIGGSGDDTVGSDATGGRTINGGGGTGDLVTYAGVATAVTIDLTGGAGTDTITNVENATGGTQGDTITGSAVANRLEGGPGADTINAGAGDDTIVGDGAGGDAIDGQGDVDRVTYAGVATPVIVDFRSPAGVGTDSLANVENATGGTNDDTFFSTATGGRDIVGGGAGATGDTVSYIGVVAPTSLVIDLTGGAGTDTLTAIRNAVGGAGDDTFHSNDAGGRQLTGGGGVDTVTYAGTATALVIDLRGTPGTDTLTGFTNATGGSESDMFFSTALGGRLLVGGGGTADSVSYAGVMLTSLTIDLRGTPGTDTLTGFRDATGGAGDDTFFSNALGGRLLDGGGGIDSISYAGVLAPTSLTIDLRGTPGTDKLTGFTNATGGAGDDLVISTAAGGRLLDGGGGTDRISYAGALTGVTINLASGAGTDMLTGFRNATGGSGDDTFVSDATGGRDLVGGGAGAAGDTVSYIGVVAPTSLTIDLVGGAGTDTLTAIRNATGGAGDDTFRSDATGGRALNGGGGSDIVSYAAVLAPTSLTIDLRGTPGTDTLTGFHDAIGGGGNDTFFSTALGGRLLVGGGGVDTVSYAGVTLASLTIDLRGTPGTDTLTGFTNATGGGGNDTFFSNALGGRLLVGGGGTDSISYAGVLAPTSLTIDLRGTPGTDRLTGFTNATGGTGDDLFFSTAAGGRVLNGGGGTTDRISYAGAPTGVTIDLVGGVGTDALTGFRHATGGDGGDAILSDATGGRSLDGGPGIDSLSYPGVATPLTINLNGGAGTDALANIENATGGSVGDAITGNASVANRLLGGAGNDTIVAQGDAGDTIDCGPDADTITYAGVATPVTVDLTGGPGTDAVAGCEDVIGGDAPAGDTLIGDGGPNHLDGREGADTLVGNGGADVLEGGGGLHDTVSYAATAGRVDVSLDGIANDGLDPGGISEGDNVVSTENITGGPGSDRLAGNQGDNVIAGGAGDDTLIGGGGSDTLDGGAGGFDTVSYEDRLAPEGVTVTINSPNAGGGNGENDSLSNFERLVGGAGDDVLSGSPANDDIEGAGGADVIAGGDGNDVLDGDAGNDTINGGAGSDQLDGGADDDRLDGSLDADAFDGGDGNDDINAFDGTSENVICGRGVDRVDHDLVDTFSAGDCEFPNLLGFVPPAFVLDPRQRDRDRDGVFAGSDCNDFDPSIHPGAPDVPGDAIDQDCNGSDAPFMPLTTEFRWGFDKAPLGTRVKILQVRKVPAGATIDVRCISTRSPGCVFKNRVRHIDKRTATVSVRGYFGDRPLARGSRIEIRVSATRSLGRFISFTMRKDRKTPVPKRGCLAANSSDVVACP